MSGRITTRLPAFMAVQWKKTVESPIRLYVIPLNLARRFIWRPLYGCYLRLVANATRVISIKSQPEQVRAHLFERAVAQFHDNQPRQAWEIFQRLLPGNRNPHHFFVAAACLVQGLGRCTEAVKYFARANELRWDAAKALNVVTNRFRVLDNFWSAHFGHTATLDYVIKLGILEGRAPCDTILYVPPGSTVANRFLLEQFRPFLQLVERPEDLPFPEQAVDALQYTFLGPRCPNGETRFFWEVAAKTYRQWNAERRKPLLSLPREIDERGYAALATAGMPRDAWFVALHVRESGSNFAYRGVHNVLNARLVDYLPAISEIAGRGGWVIRMGDPNMAALPPMPKVIDYCHSATRSDWMDVFLAARCRFLLGTSSGPAYVPPAYGVRSVLTNWWPPAQRPWHVGDIFIPKRYRRLSDLHRLTLRDTLVEPFAWCNAVKYLEERYGVVVEDNDAEDIRAATVEMLDQLDGTAQYDQADLRRREEAHQIQESMQAFGAAHLGRNFLRRYPDYLA